MSKVRAFILSASCLFAQLPVHAADLMADGEKLYGEGRFDLAGRCFAARLVAEPDDATAHYLLGNCYVKLKRVPDAIKQYERAAEIDEDGKIAQYSNKALSGLVHTPPAAPTAQTSATANAATPSSSANVSSTAAANVGSSSGGNDATLTRNSAMAISKQADENARRASAEFEAKIAKIKEEGSTQIRQLEKEMSARIAEVGGSRYYKGVKVFDPTEQNNAIKEEYTPRIDQLKRDLDRRIEDATANYKTRAAAMEDSAIMLDKEYLKPGRNVRLSPTGRSDIYVRNFETADEPSGNPVPVYAAPAKSLSATAPPTASKHRIPTK